MGPAAISPASCPAPITFAIEHLATVLVQLESLEISATSTVRSTLMGLIANMSANAEVKTLTDVTLS